MNSWYGFCLKYTCFKDLGLSRQKKGEKIFQKLPTLVFQPALQNLWTFGMPVTANKDFKTPNEPDLTRRIAGFISF